MLCLLKKGVIIGIPSGIIFGKSPFYNIGPVIPVRASLIGNVLGDVVVKARDYGINNSLIEVYIKITITEKVMLPMSYENVSMSYNVFVGSRLINGKLPDYYFNNELNKYIFMGFV